MWFSLHLICSPSLSHACVFWWSVKGSDPMMWVLWSLLFYKWSCRNQHLFYRWSSGSMTRVTELESGKARIWPQPHRLWGFPGGTVIKNLPGNVRDTGSIAGSGRSPTVGDGNALQYSCLENSIDIGAWWATIHGVAKNQTRLSMHILHWLWSLYTTVP